MTLDDGVTTITLPDSLEWFNEYNWSPVGQDIRATIGNGIIIQESLVVAGRPITLRGGEFVWITKTVLDALKALYDVPDKSYTLTLPDARTFNVVFDRSSGAGLEAVPIWRKNVQDTTDYFTITLTLMEV
jgi:hypothetical protein